MAMAFVSDLTMAPEFASMVIAMRIANRSMGSEVNLDLGMLIHPMVVFQSAMSVWVVMCSQFLAVELSTE